MLLHAITPFLSVANRSQGAVFRAASLRHSSASDSVLFSRRLPKEKESPDVAYAVAITVLTKLKQGTLSDIAVVNQALRHWKKLTTILPPTVRPTFYFPTADFLKEVHAPGLDLSRMRIRSKDSITGEDIPVDFRYAQLPEASFTKSDLEEADFTGADLSKAKFTKARLAKANFLSATLNGAKFLEANLFQAGFISAQLWKADFTGAYLARADLSSAKLNQANLTRATLLLAILNKANLTDADFTNANLSEVNLKEVDLTGVDLSKANGLLTTNFFAAKGLTPEHLPSAVVSAIEQFLASRTSAVSGSPVVVNA